MSNNLDGLLNEQKVEEVPAHEPSEDDLWVRVVEGLGGLEGTLTEMQQAVLALATRVSVLEKFVGHLVSKDPEISEKIKAHQEAQK